MLPSSRLMLWSLAGAFAFVAAIALLDNRLAHFVIGPDRPGMWYEWQLTAPGWASRASAWTGYALHQIAFWALIWKAQHSKLQWTDHAKPINLVAFAVTAIFILLHLVQTHFWYDGIAQDVHEGTSQWSVILLLLMIILMENRRRGITFGMRWGGFVEESGGILRRYHGYYFSWAAIYTFWYHPMIATPGHLAGFLYMFLLFIQGSLFFTRAHLNRWWTATLELMVLFHGVAVAVVAGDGNWQMFAFGLAGVFVVTQCWGLGFSRRTCLALVGAYALVVIAYYSQWDWRELPRVFRILGGYYVALPVLAALVVGLARLVRNQRD